jgi:isopenicillin-N epimerase
MKGTHPAAKMIEEVVFFISPPPIIGLSSAYTPLIYQILFMKTPSVSPRRNFLKQLIGGSMTTLALPVFAAPVISAQPIKSLPSLKKDVADEQYWELVKKQFAVPLKLTMMNAANLCPAPYLINEQVQASLKGLSQDVSFQYRARFADIRKKSIGLLADYVGVAKEEVGITRNTSESNNIVVNGLDLKAGDEVIVWDQNHPTNNIAWENRAKRYGFVVKKVVVPASPQSINDLILPFVKAVTSRTKLIGFSHISNISGIALPAKELCQLARERKILSLLDGAQSFGMMDLNLKDIGCDFYTGSTHKWLMGPLENGILYINKESSVRVWPNIISAGWKEESLTVDEKFCVLGQRNDATLAGLPETIEFHYSIGKKNIQERVLKLNAYLKDEIQKKIPTAVFVTPVSPSLSAGVTVINVPEKKSGELFQKLYEIHGIAGASTSGVRLSPHIYNSMSDIDKVVDALASLR